MRHKITKAAAVVIFLVGTVLEAFHYFKLLDEIIPESLTPVFNERTNFILIVVGILLWVLTWADQKYGGVHKKEEIAKEPASPKPLSVSQTANPSVTVSPTIAVNPQFNIPLPTPTVRASPKIEEPAQAVSVTFVGSKEVYLSLDVNNFIPVPKSSLSAIAVGFRINPVDGDNRNLYGVRAHVII